MAMYTSEMDISVTAFKHRCLELIRQVEATGKAVSITRRGKVVAQLDPAPVAADARARPWERLRGRARWLAEPGETVIDEGDIRGL